MQSKNKFYTGVSFDLKYQENEEFQALILQKYGTFSNFVNEQLKKFYEEVYKNG